MGVIALPKLTPLGFVEAEKDTVPPRSEESRREESQPKQPDNPVQQNLILEQGPPPLMVQLGLLRAETDR